MGHSDKIQEAKDKFKEWWKKSTSRTSLSGEERPEVAPDTKGLEALVARFLETHPLYRDCARELREYAIREQGRSTRQE
jgi:hypothetical protein